MPIAAMLLAAMLWASTMVGNKLLVSVMAVSEVALLRFSLGALVLWMLVTWRGELGYLRGMDRRPLLMGLMEPGMVGLLVIWGQFYTSAINATVFWSLMPLMMPLLGRLVLGEPVRVAVVIAALVALAGTVLLVYGQNTHGVASLKGDLLCIAGVLCACLNQLLARRVAQTRPRPMLTTAVQLTTAAALALAVLALVERPEVAGIQRNIPDYWMLMLYMGVVGSAGPFMLYNYALRHMPVGRISLFLPLVAPFGAGMAALALDEPLLLQDMAAIALMLLAVFLPSLADRLRGRRA